MRRRRQPWVRRREEEDEKEETHKEDDKAEESPARGSSGASSSFSRASSRSTVSSSARTRAAPRGAADVEGLQERGARAALRDDLQLPIQLLEDACSTVEGNGAPAAKLGVGSLRRSAYTLLRTCLDGEMRKRVMRRSRRMPMAVAAESTMTAAGQASAVPEAPETKNMDEEDWGRKISSLAVRLVVAAPQLGSGGSDLQEVLRLTGALLVLLFLAPTAPQGPSTATVIASDPALSSPFSSAPSGSCRPNASAGKGSTTHMQTKNTTATVPPAMRADLLQTAAILALDQSSTTVTEGTSGSADGGSRAANVLPPPPSSQKTSFHQRRQSASRDDQCLVHTLALALVEHLPKLMKQQRCPGSVALARWTLVQYVNEGAPSDWPGMQQHPQPPPPAATDDAAAGGGDGRGGGGNASDRAVLDRNDAAASDDDEDDDDDEQDDSEASQGSAGSGNNASFSALNNLSPVESLLQFVPGWVPALCDRIARALRACVPPASTVPAANGVTEPSSSTLEDTRPATGWAQRRRVAAADRGVDRMTTARSNVAAAAAAVVTTSSQTAWSATRATEAWMLLELLNASCAREDGQRRVLEHRVRSFRGTVSKSRLSGGMVEHRFVQDLASVLRSLWSRAMLPSLERPDSPPAASSFPPAATARGASGPDSGSAFAGMNAAQSSRVGKQIWRECKAARISHLASWVRERQQCIAEHMLDPDAVDGATLSDVALSTLRTLVNVTHHSRECADLLLAMRAHPSLMNMLHNARAARIRFDRLTRLERGERDLKRERERQRSQNESSILHSPGFGRSSSSSSSSSSTASPTRPPAAATSSGNAETIRSGNAPSTPSTPHATTVRRVKRLVLDDLHELDADEQAAEQAAAIRAAATRSAERMARGGLASATDSPSSGSGPVAVPERPHGRVWWHRFLFDVELLVLTTLANVAEMGRQHQQAVSRASVNGELFMLYAQDALALEMEPFRADIADALCREHVSSRSTKAGGAGVDGGTPSSSSSSSSFSSSSSAAAATGTPSAGGRGLAERTPGTPATPAGAHAAALPLEPLVLSAHWSLLLSCVLPCLTRSQLRFLAKSLPGETLRALAHVLKGFVVVQTKTGVCTKEMLAPVLAMMQQAQKYGSKLEREMHQATGEGGVTNQATSSNNVCDDGDDVLLFSPSTTTPTSTTSPGAGTPASRRPRQAQLLPPDTSSPGIALASVSGGGSRGSGLRGRRSGGWVWNGDDYVWQDDGDDTGRDHDHNEVEDAGGDDDEINKDDKDMLTSARERRNHKKNGESANDAVAVAPPQKKQRQQRAFPKRGPHKQGRVSDASSTVSSPMAPTGRSPAEFRRPPRPSPDSSTGTHSDTHGSLSSGSIHSRRAVAAATATATATSAAAKANASPAPGNRAQHAQVSRKRSFVLEDW